MREQSPLHHAVTDARWRIRWAARFVKKHHGPLYYAIADSWFNITWAARDTARRWWVRKKHERQIRRVRMKYQEVGLREKSNAAYIGTSQQPRR